MGDKPPRSPAGDFPEISQDARSNASYLPPGSSSLGTGRGKPTVTQPSNPSTSYSSNHPFPSQQYGPQQVPNAFMLAGLAGALPDTTYHSYSNLPSPNQMSNQPSSGLPYPMQNIPQFYDPQGPSTSISNVPYAGNYQGQHQGMYPTAQATLPQQLQSGATASHNFQSGYVPQHQQLSHQYLLQSNQYSPQGQIYLVNSTTPQDGMGNSFSGESRQQPVSKYLRVGQSSGAPAKPGNIASRSGKSSVVRGPPRKPRQSGHAIWIGNLPPQTDLMSLVFHMCKETPELESLFLISKSNCAFANYKDEATCISAQAKIHDSRFHNVRLVSRLRRSSVGTETDPVDTTASTPPDNIVAHSPSPMDKTIPKEPSPEVDGGKAGTEKASSPKDKFFIVKSLTVEDLELSLRNGMWATQSHNEEALNKAYQAAENVYLIFSANKSGEYFGYARMASPLNDDPAAAIEFAPKPQFAEDPELPKAIPTPATEFAPKGRIIDDSARGTIFWEVDRDEDDEEDADADNRSDQEDLEAPSSKAWGKPFKIEWVSTTRVPFYRTRGLRNPWNSNREVKVARDGTELEPSVGRGLLGLFHRTPSPSVPQVQGGPVPTIGRLPQMRPFQ